LLWKWEDAPIDIDEITDDAAIGAVSDEEMFDLIDKELGRS
jgi:hypothetical protein